MYQSEWIDTVSAIGLALFSLLDPSFSEWSVRAVVLLVAAAPCALVMSTPVAVAAVHEVAELIAVGNGLRVARKPKI